MLLLASSLAYVFIPVTAPPGVDPTVFAVKIALVTDNGMEPGTGDWYPATWLAPRPGAAPEAALLVGPGQASFPPGEYMAYVTLAAGAEAPVIQSGRVRIGDARD
jgi:hypothetical protein